jgi:integrase
MKDGRTVWYYQAWDGDRRISGQSTGLTSKTDARKHCARLKAAGKLIPPKDAEAPIPTLREWAEAETWWQWGKCRYIRAQLARSTSARPAVSRRYCDDALRELCKYILPAHGEKRLDAITSRDCERLLFAWQDGGLSKKSVNNKASIYRIMLSEAARLGTIERNPWEKVRSFAPDKLGKGIPTMEEARRLLNPATVATVWKDSALYYSASLLASVTGLRLGEVLALRRADLFPDHAHVAGSWAYRYGLGKTKTKRIDDLPLPRFVFDAIDAWCAWDGFIFSFKRGDRPCSANRVAGALIDALERIGIPAEERTRRRLSFHSWRAFANTYMRAAGISGEKVRQLTRHDSEQMTEHYSAFRLEDFKDVAAAQEALVTGFKAEK